MNWRFLEHPTPRIGEVVKRWEGTPYKDNQRIRQQGVDCKELVVGLLDDLFRVEQPTIVPRINSATALHDRRKSMRVIHAMLQGWYGTDRVRDETIEPGDVLITRSTANNLAHEQSLPLNPGHAVFVTSEPWQVLHCFTGAGAIRQPIEHVGRTVIRIYRPRRKELWI